MWTVNCWNKEVQRITDHTFPDKSGVFFLKEELDNNG